VKESFGDDYQVQPGQSFKKSWTFRNEGKTAWPEDTLFVSISGDDLGAVPKDLKSTVNPNEEHTWVIEFVAPTKEGRYTNYFKMFHGEKNERFGHNVWCRINVVDPSKAKEAESKEVVSPAVVYP